MALGLQQRTLPTVAGNGYLLAVTGMDGIVSAAVVARAECYVQVVATPPGSTALTKPGSSPAPAAGQLASWGHMQAGDIYPFDAHTGAGPGGANLYVAIWAVATGDVEILANDMGPVKPPSLGAATSASIVTLLDTAGNYPGDTTVESALADLAARIAILVYGDGSDGVGAFDGATTVAGLAPSTNVYTMTADLNLSAFTISAGVTVYKNGFKFRCNGTGTIAATGHLSHDGKAAALGVAGVATNASGTLGIGTAGGAGATSDAAGSAGTNQTNGLPGGAVAATGAGGQGGGGPHTGAAGGTYTVATAVKGGGRDLLGVLLGMMVGTASSGTVGALTPIQGGAGGGGGSGDSGSSVGGGGGGGGGPMVVAIKNLVNNGAIHCNGGAGAAATGTTNVGGGGGGGGGTLYLVTRTKSGAGAVTAAGGAGGAKVGTGLAGLPGAAGNVIQTTF